jgi:hypothetical protein
MDDGDDLLKVVVVNEIDRESWELRDPAGWLGFFRSLAPVF